MYSEAPKELLTEVYLTEDALAEVGTPQVPYYLVEPAVFARISDTQTPQGVLSVLKRPEHSLEGIIKGEIVDHSSLKASGDLRASKDSRVPLILVLENLQDPGNLGTILRVGEAAGVTGIIMSKGTVDIYNPKVVRSTMGSIYRMPFVTVPDIIDTVRKIKESGIVTYAAHLQGSEIYTDYDYTSGTAFFIGNEGNGLSDEITALADKKLFIPMEGSVESLNAGIAASVLVYEAHRQRYKS